MHKNRLKKFALLLLDPQFVIGEMQFRTYKLLKGVNRGLNSSAGEAIGETTSPSGLIKLNISIKHLSTSTFPFRINQTPD